MIRRLFIASFICFGMFAFGSAQAATITPTGDYVSDVYLCGPNTIQIFLKSGTVLEVDFADSAHMTDGLFNQLYAMALQLLSSGKQVGYYNNLKTETVCGVSAIEINSLAASNAP